MKVFIWQRIEKCSDSYHPEGGVVVFADNIERAMELAKKEGCEFQKSETPNETRTIAKGPLGERVFIFEDAGCC